MNNTAVNIMDLMSGAIDASNIEQSVAVPPSSENSALFSQILSGLMPVVDGQNGEVVANPEGQAQIDPSFRAIMSNLPLALDAEPATLADPTAGMAEAVADDGLLTMEDDLLQPFVDDIKNRSLKELLVTRPIEPEAGDYQVLKASVSDGTLNLTVAGKSDPNQTIRLSVPVELLQQSSDQMASWSGAQERVPLVNSSSNDLAVEKLLLQMNLKELQISAGSETLNPNKLDLSLTSENASLMLKGWVAKKDIKAVAEMPVAETIEESATVVKAARNAADLTGQLSPRAKSTNSQNVTPTATADPNPIWDGVSASTAKSEAAQNAVDLLTGRLKGNRALTEFDLADRFTAKGEAAQSTNQTQAFDTVFGLEKAENSHLSGQVKTTARPLRFTLPEDLGATLKPNGQSIMIRIEPDHLGPAKLSLWMSDDKLNARLVVSSVEARKAIEHSVDKLISQLADADIDVERIEVSVGGDAERHQFHERRPRWQNTEQKYRVDLDNDITETEAAVKHAAAVTSGYHVSETGVNLLA